MTRTLRSLAIYLALLLPFLGANDAIAQCENKSGFAKLVCQAQANNANNSALAPGMNDPRALTITTGFADTIHLDTLPPTFEPKAFKPLTGLDRTDDGAFVLKAGMYEVYAQSYTLDASDPNITKPGGYYPAPIKGTKAKIVAAILKNVELHPDVTQADVQQLLFAVVAGTDLEKMPPQIQQVAVRVLPREIVTQMQGATQAKAIEKSLMDMLNQRFAKDKNAQQKLAQMNDAMKQMQQSGGFPPSFRSDAESDVPVARGTWAQMPGGFYVRYLPDGYMKTRLQVMVPDAAIAQADPKSPLTFDPTQFLAVLGQAPSERIGVTLRVAH